MRILLNGINPRSPTAAGFRIRPCAVRLQHSVQSNDPWSHLNVNERDVLSQEKWPVFVRSIDELANFRLQFLGILDLLFIILLLQETVEPRNEVAVDLLAVSSRTVGWAIGS